jgi:hypothetical protein
MKLRLHKNHYDARKDLLIEFAGDYRNKKPRLQLV